MSEDRLVYSTETGGACPACGKPLQKCRCSPARPGKGKTQKPAPKRDGVVRISLERKGRKGKGVTLIAGLPLTMDQLKDLSKELKTKCGSGGTVKDGVIEIQGDHRDALLDEMKSRGYTAKRVGG